MFHFSPQFQGDSFRVEIPPSKKGISSQSTGKLTTQIFSIGDRWKAVSRPIVNRTGYSKAFRNRPQNWKCIGSVEHLYYTVVSSLLALLSGYSVL
jgi:hypothetical protein